jgi:hypothetical protein
MSVTCISLTSSEASSSVLLTASACLDRPELAFGRSCAFYVLAFCNNSHCNSLCLLDFFELIHPQYVYAHQEATVVDRYGCQMAYLASATTHDRCVRRFRFFESSVCPFTIGDLLQKHLFASFVITTLIFRQYASRESSPMFYPRQSSFLLRLDEHSGWGTPSKGKTIQVLQCFCLKTVCLISVENSSSDDFGRNNLFHVRICLFHRNSSIESDPEPYLFCPWQICSF